MFVLPAFRTALVVVTAHRQLCENHKQTDDNSSSSHDDVTLLMSLPSDRGTRLGLEAGRNSSSEPRVRSIKEPIG